MLKNWQKKLIAMLLIFTLTFGNFAIVGKAYAASILGGIFSEEDTGDTGSANVEFDACFIDEDKKENTEIKADVNSENLMIQVSVDVKNTGYLKDAKVSLGNGNSLNFNIISDEIELDENVQSFENNELALVQLNAGTDIKIAFPFEYQNEKYVNTKNVSKTNVIKFEGTYINDKAEEVQVSKEVNLKLDWIDSREAKLSSEVTKYIPYTSDGVSGLILQTLIKVDNTTELKTLPIKSSKLNVEVPIINDVKASTINVVATSTAGINGKKDDEVVFNQDNWSYNKEKNTISINVNNDSELVSPQSEDEILIDETIPKEERYYSLSGTDEYLITYTYENVLLENFNLTSNISETYEFFGSSESLKVSDEINYEVSEQIGDIVTYSSETATDSISKGYTYLNYNNEQNKYEIEIDEKLIFNVSYKDIVDALYFQDAGSYYVTKSGEIINQNDIYYKLLAINKENFDLMLGEDGYINFYDEAGNLLITINKDTEISEEGKYELKINSSVKYLSIETSKPISDGNLIISTIKAYSGVSFGKEDYKNFDRIAINTVGKAKYIYLEELADCGNAVTEVKLNDTTTNAELELGQDTLSTLAMNDNVELKIKLNNENIESDVYGDSEFKIKMPDYVETVEITNASIVYGEGLEITNVSAFEENGNIYIVVSTSGKQSALSSGIISNGTNIVLDSNIKVDLYAPAAEETFELTYTNSEVTDYENEKDGTGYNDASVTYSAPSGVVSVNSTTNYNDDGSTLTSVKQGKQVDEIPVYASEKEATMELTVMNNEGNAISNVKILGRIPFEGVRDIVTGEDLGTTVTTKMTSGIVADAANTADFTIYYSENGEATADLTDSSNGWTTQFSSIENVKSYLIVPNDEAYQMENAQKVRFSYSYQIPGNLEHNQEIYGTFATYFTNNTAVATFNDVSVADLIGLETGVGPQLSIKTELGNSELKEYEQLELTTIVTNTGKVDAKDVVVEIPLASGMRFENFTSNIEGVNKSIEDSKVLYKLSSLEKGSELKITTLFNLNSVLMRINSQVEVYSTVTATDLDTTLESNREAVTMDSADLRINIGIDTPNKTFQKGDGFALTIDVSNMKDENVNNAVVTMNVEDILKVLDSYVVEYTSDNTEVNIDNKGIFNENTGTITWNIKQLKANEQKRIVLQISVKQLDGNITKKEVNLSATVKADGTDTYTSKVFTVNLGKPSLIISQTSTNTNSYVKEGEPIEYVFSITNEGGVTANSVKLSDKIPDGLVVRSVSYKVGTSNINRNVSEKEEVNVDVPIASGETVDVKIVAIPTSLDGVQELSVTNVGTIKNGDDVIESNKITHIIEPGDQTAILSENNPSEDMSSFVNTGSSKLNKTYKISGIAWLDSNNDGMRTDDEKLMKNIKATLVDSDNGVIKQTVTTNAKGEYTFTGVYNGNYIIIFDYDTVLYTVTAYQKENVTSNVNSDVITTKIEQDGVLRNGAVTDVITISDGSISNIDIGFVEAMKFDLALNMGISKITIQNSQGTKTTEYDMSTMTKTEIGAKQMDGSEVYIEYTFEVKNEGEISGYAKKVVDYIPDGMKFNSGMNSDWYTGSDGNLYTIVLANTEIAPGETKTFKLVLSKTMTNDNTGVVTNIAEIVEDYNIYGVSDIDSIPGNKAQNEDDFSRADVYLSVKTGEVFIYISVIITTILLVSVAVVVVVLKVKYRLVKGGV